MIHVIVVKDARRRGRDGMVGLDRSFVFYAGVSLGEMRTPCCSTARWLLERSLASRDDLIAMVRDRDASDQISPVCDHPYLCMAGSVGWFADHTVIENEKVGPVWGRWKPFPARGVDGKTAAGAVAGTLAAPERPAPLEPETPEAASG
jgi:hypothetical protein